MWHLYKNRTFGSILMVAGTTIGAGMLALPLKTAAGGLFPSITLFIFCFAFMLYTVTLLLEANLMMPHPSSNIISMAGERLGRSAQGLAWVLFLLLLFSVSAAYMSAGGSLISVLLKDMLHIDMPDYPGMFIFAIIFGVVVFFGTSVTEHINRILLLGMIISFAVLLFDMTPHLDTSTYGEGDPILLLPAMTVILLSFTSHVMLPSIREYLDSKPKKIIMALLLGSMIPLVFYIAWEVIILGLFPLYGDQGMITIAKGAHPVATMVHILQDNFGLLLLATVVGAFSFCALVTSFLAVNLSLRDFLADGLNMKKTPVGRLYLSVLAIIPPLIYALLFPKGYITALEYAGIIVALLYGILPAAMVYQGRYIARAHAPFTTPGGKIGLWLVGLIALMIIILELLM
jgi:tyrosine-specific transport protein